LEKTKVAILGSGFCADIHAESYNRFVRDAEITAVCGTSLEKSKAFAKKHKVKEWYDDVDKLLASCECDVIDICLPNFLHADACIKAANAGKHVIIEKPLCLTMEQADAMIDACKANNKKLMYAEELCFAPKYERVRSLVEVGAVGKIYMLKQSEKHSGPHSEWFYDVNRSGGGVLMDMGCHALAWFLWMNRGVKPKSVYAQMNTVLHGNITKGEDNMVAIVEFENGVVCVAEDSWARHGGMDDRIEVYGDKGVSYADLFQGNSALTYSLDGYDYAAEKAGATTGWTFTMFEEAFNQGYPHELTHFIECVREDKEPLVTGEDGRAVMELIYACYASAKEGRKIDLPFKAKVEKPIDLWLG